MPEDPDKLPQTPEDAASETAETSEVTSGPELSSDASLGVDPALEAAMREAEASYERRKKGEDPGVEVEIETETVGAPAAGAGEGVIRALAEMRKARDELEVMEERAKDLEDRLLRSTADFENYKKRVARERDDERKFAVERLLKDLLPVLDNMERAMEASRQAGHEQIVAGVEMVHKQFIEVLGRYGVEQFSALGKKFDPNFHEAMQEQETAEVPPGHVAMEFMRGYTLQGRLVRPAMVMVAKAPAEAGPQSDGPGAAAAVASEVTEAAGPEGGSGGTAPAPGGPVGEAGAAPGKPPGRHEGD